jgi:hypothetical protein
MSTYIWVNNDSTGLNTAMIETVDIAGEGWSRDRYEQYGLEPGGTYTVMFTLTSGRTISVSMVSYRLWKLREELSCTVT